MQIYKLQNNLLNKNYNNLQIQNKFQTPSFTSYYGNNLYDEEFSDEIYDELEALSKYNRVFTELKKQCEDDYYKDRLNEIKKQYPYKTRTIEKVRKVSTPTEAFEILNRDDIFNEYADAFSKIIKAKNPKSNTARFNGSDILKQLDMIAEIATYPDAYKLILQRQNKDNSPLYSANDCVILLDAAPKISEHLDLFNCISNANKADGTPLFEAKQCVNLMYHPDLLAKDLEQTNKIISLMCKNGITDEKFLLHQLREFYRKEAVTRDLVKKVEAVEEAEAKALEKAQKKSRKRTPKPKVKTTSQSTSKTTQNQRVKEQERTRQIIENQQRKVQQKNIAARNIVTENIVDGDILRNIITRNIVTRPICPSVAFLDDTKSDEIIDEETSITYCFDINVCMSSESLNYKTLNGNFNVTMGSGSITGNSTVNGDVKIIMGSLDIAKNSRINGDVCVDKGSADIKDSKINGNVSTTSGTTKIENSTINGSLDADYKLLKLRENNKIRSLNLTQSNSNISRYGNVTIYDINTGSDEQPKSNEIPKFTLPQGTEILEDVTFETDNEGILYLAPGAKVHGKVINGKIIELK